jgi:putative serine/threonine protein kinase
MLSTLPHMAKIYSQFLSHPLSLSDLGIYLHQSNVVYLERFFEEKYGRVLCYPKYDSSELKSRINELNRLGVKALEFVGEKTVSNVSVLGKGCVGIVVVAYTEKGKGALKIRRMDADRSEMQHEAEMLKKANTVEVGPKLLGASENFLLMEFIKGLLLFQWISMLKGRGTKSRIQKVLRDILEQCWRLDEIGLDHGELSKAPKHIIIDEEDKPHIVDFETASINRRVSNVTSICQYLFVGSEVAKLIKRRLGYISKDALIESLKTYKTQRSRQNFENILKTCELHNA